MMEKLTERGEALARASARRERTELKSALREELPDHMSVEEIEDGIEIGGPRLSEQMMENSSLRDIAFLMRGVR